jgi:hypothetical protein
VSRYESLRGGLRNLDEPAGGVAAALPAIPVAAASSSAMLLVLPVDCGMVGVVGVEAVVVVVVVVVACVVGGRELARRLRLIDDSDGPLLSERKALEMVCASLSRRLNARPVVSDSELSLGFLRVKGGQRKRAVVASWLLCAHQRVF